MDSDSVPLEAPAASAQSCAPGIKSMLALFLMFLVVVSRTFTGSVLNAFGEKAVNGSTPTAWGIVLQGLFLTVGYAVSSHLIGNGTL